MNTFSSQLSYTPSTLSSVNIQLLLRNQLQNIINNFAEVLSSVNILNSKKGYKQKRENHQNIDKKIQQAFIDIVINQEKYIIDKFLVPLITEINRPNSKILASTFYENRFGFTEEELLNAEFNNDSSIIVPLRQQKSVLFNGKLNNSFQYTSKRGFKTRRPQGREPEDEMSLLKRLITSKQVNQDINNGIVNPLQKLKFADVFAQKVDNIRGSSDKTSGRTSDDLNKIKLAFAEGYLAHDALIKKKQQDKSNFYKILRFLIFASIVGFFVFSPFVSIKTNDSTPGQPGSTGIKFRVALPGNKITEVKPEDVDVRFTDVRGVHEAKEELQDIVDYLKDPTKFTRLGAHLPKGVLLVGPPGVGKTLLAKAVAGEAGVPFFHASGSEFDEMFVGTGARKMRQLFQSARQRAPCVIFIDEVDSVGAKRTNSPMHPYANQTINQMLAEMDGFEKNVGIIVLAATNRPENLDSALTRPGRFDVQVGVDAPDFKGRLEILELYLGKIVQGSDIDINRIARKTVGFTGAELENLVNQAALRAALDNENEVSMKDIEWGYEKITMGPAKLSKIPDDETNRVTAYHEAGHTLIAYYTKDAMPLSKVTIIPRGRALGYTAMMPTEKDQYGKTKSQLLASIDVSLGGRIAEELIFGNENVTTGASSDFKSATQVAENMIKYWGMSEKLGFRVVVQKNEYESENLSPQSQEIVDQEIRRLLQESYDRAKNILKTRSGELKALAEALLQYETLDADEIKAIIEGNKLPLRTPKSEGGSSSNKQKQQQQQQQTSTGIGKIAVKV
jgi:ATP-dependent metalloprotease